MGRSRAKRPTLAQKRRIRDAGLEPKDWLVLADAVGIGMRLVHRTTGTSRVIENEPTGGNRQGSKTK